MKKKNIILIIFLFSTLACGPFLCLEPIVSDNFGLECSQHITNILNSQTYTDPAGDWVNQPWTKKVDLLGLNISENVTWYQFTFSFSHALSWSDTGYLQIYFNNGTHDLFMISDLKVVNYQGWFWMRDLLTSEWIQVSNGSFPYQTDLNLDKAQWVSNSSSSITIIMNIAWFYGRFGINNISRINGFDFRVRALYSSYTVDIMPSISLTYFNYGGFYSEPILSNGLVTPGIAAQGSQITFGVTYTDFDNQQPTYVNVSINDTMISLSKVNPSDNIYYDGVDYSGSVVLNQVGNYLIHFNASDGINSTRFPTSTNMTVEITSTPSQDVSSQQKFVIYLTIGLILAGIVIGVILVYLKVTDRLIIDF